MNIILLSGGSGKRLWPLSNDVRSKQFIKIFKNDQGEYESMLQRVYRQIQSVDKNARITIATSESQSSAIINQLGGKAFICMEPCRRDTFPAIILAASYLVDVRHADPNECVAICPVDPYVEESYYKTVKSLERVVRKYDTNLALMGILPTEPSDKYGYIIPEDKSRISDVKAFKEKPDVATAKGYLAQGALWNAGVFACKLSYLLQKAKELTGFNDYKNLLQKYGELQKISFDYAVVEREPNIKVVRYDGEWRDVGTWNMMAEVMAESSIGDVMLDASCKNTNVINELDIPVLGMGLKNMIIAVSNDGILVAEKKKSGDIKPFVEEIDQEAKFAVKSWGTYTVINSQEGSSTIKVSMLKGSQMAYHSHEHRDEIWTVISGTGKMLLNGTMRQVSPGDTVMIPKGMFHTVMAETDMDIIEVQIGKRLDKQDKIVVPVTEEFAKARIDI